MYITDRNHELYLDMDRFFLLQEENPDLLGYIMQRRLDQGLKEIYAERKALGLSVYYSDEEYPEGLIREDADGRRFIVKGDAANNYQEVVVREIPPRRLAA